MTPTIRFQLEALFRKYDEKARAMYPAYARFPVPKLVFFQKGRHAGLAEFGAKWTVSINEYIASQNMTIIENTVSHEIAHMVDYAIRLRSGHDAHWKRIHRSLCGNGERCYNSAGQTVTTIPGRRTTEHLYRGDNGEEIWIGPKYHTKFQRNQSWFRSLCTGTRFEYHHYTGQSRIKA